jgi:O-antigen/teichoic acid export membrane protein
MDIIIHFIDEKFRSGANVIPILLMANLFLGIYYNLSVWYKLTNKTKFGAYISIIGALITISLNFYWIPRIGFTGSAWATFICYGSMMILSYLWGKKYYPIPYNLPRILFYLGLSITFYYISTRMTYDSTNLKLVANTFILLVYISILLFMEKKSLFTKSIN